MAIHEERGYGAVPEALARSRDISILEPDIQIADVDLQGDRVLRLRHFPQNGIPLNPQILEATFQYLRALISWKTWSPSAPPEAPLDASSTTFAGGNSILTVEAHANLLKELRELYWASEIDPVLFHRSPHSTEAVGVRS